MGEIFLVAPKYGHQIWVLAAEVTLVAGTGTGPGLRWLGFVTTRSSLGGSEDLVWTFKFRLFYRLYGGSTGFTGPL